MRAVIVAGAPDQTGLDASLLRAADLLIAADGGAETLLGLKAFPGLLVGDMDSVGASTMDAMVSAGTEIVSLPTAKDETDLEHALRLAVDKGAERIDIWGALGGPRFDHMLGAVLLLTASWVNACDVRLWDKSHCFWLARGRAEIAGGPGDILSLLPLSPSVEAVTTVGLLYPLKNERLVRGSTRGVSNELTGKRAAVTHEQGDLLVVHYSQGRAHEATDGPMGRF